MTTDRRLLARMRELCAELGPDDGIDPRLLKKSDRTRPKLHRLAGQVQRVLREALASSDDPVLYNLWVVRAVPDPDASRFRVEVASQDDPDLVLARLAGATGWLRSELARGLARRRTPELVFAWGIA